MHGATKRDQQDGDDEHHRDQEEHEQSYRGDKIAAPDAATEQAVSA